MRWRKHDPYHQRLRGMIKKRCLNPECSQIYKDVTALSIVPVNAKKPQPGLCPQCKNNEDNDYSEEDWNNQNLSFEV